MHYNLSCGDVSIFIGLSQDCTHFLNMSASQFIKPKDWTFIVLSPKTSSSPGPVPYLWFIQSHGESKNYCFFDSWLQMYSHMHCLVERTCRLILKQSLLSSASFVAGYDLVSEIPKPHWYSVHRAIVVLHWFLASHAELGTLQILTRSHGPGIPKSRTFLFLFFPAVDMAGVLLHLYISTRRSRG